ncbi:hypothetical protein ADIS_4062 [Lunatimonas lonarensis]|uniref:DUF4097 domain-containing protein n=1 Tax=Lunatimonas lonarensis TaxID=1232681 RepID=R7ZMN8_9BACT|nr:DUF4097 family beta strand repeat-containing protein [Lunatimonas lonarensis]EON75358.1 hypothetical protein ADIS_4062 [Lunatimonas lonarensis]
MDFHKTTFLLGILLLFSGSLLGQELIEKSFGQIEVLEMDIGGVDVAYVGIPGKEDISLSAMFGKTEDGARNFFMVTVGTTLKLSYKTPSKPIPPLEKRFIRLEGPEQIRIVAKNSTGLLSIRNVTSAETRLSVNSGSIRSQQIRGDLVLRANSGRIEVQQVTGDVVCSVASGEADLTDVTGRVTLTASSGSLKGKNLLGLVQVTLSSGNARLDQLGELGSVTVSSGNVRITKAELGPETQFTGSSGNIDVSTSSDLSNFNFQLVAGSGSLKVGNISNTKALQIDNGAEVTIRGAMRSGSLRITN